MLGSNRARDQAASSDPDPTQNVGQNLSPPTPAGSPTTPRVREKPAKYSANAPTPTPDGSIRPRVREKPAKYSANTPTLPLAPSATPSPAPTEVQSPPPTLFPPPPTLFPSPPDRRPAAIPVRVLRHPHFVAFMRRHASNTPPDSPSPQASSRALRHPRSTAERDTDTPTRDLIIVRPTDRVPHSTAHRHPSSYP